MKHSVSDDEEQQIVALYTGGFGGCCKIGKALKLHPATVNNVRRRNNLRPGKYQVGRWQTLTNKEIESIQTLRAQGHSTRQIGAALKRSWSAVWKYTHK